MKPVTLLTAGLLALSFSLYAQLDEWTPPAPPCRLPPAPFDGYLYVPPPVEPAQLAARQTATINVNFLPAGAARFGYTCADWPAEAETAMAYAASIWGSLLSTGSTITIDACWATGMAAGVLGSAGASNYYLLTDGVNTTWYPAALSELLLNNFSLLSVEIQAIFNSERTDWYFGTDGNLDFNEIDFATVALHELGHGLGFAGFEDIDDGSGAAECEGIVDEGCYGAKSGIWYPDIYSRQVEDNNGDPLTDISNPSLTVASLLTSGVGANGELFLGNASVLAGNGGNPARLYTPATYAPGSTYSHFDQSTFGSELMKPALNFGQAIHDPGLALNLLQGLGWPIGVTVLPVTWISFDAREKNDGVLLRWETGAEVNNAGFEIQRSKDAVHWVGIDFIPGRGEAAVYEYLDLSSYKGLNYYRLLQVDFDGRSDLSKTVSVYSHNRRGGSVGFFPNPVQEELAIAYVNFSEPTPFTITNLLGQETYRGVLSSPAEKVGLPPMPSGTYWLKVGQEAALPFVKL